MEVARSGFALPSPDEVEQLYSLASSSGAAPVEDADVAAVYAALYDLAMDRDDLVAVTAREVGELVGVAWGHAWRWADQTDEWAEELAGHLGAEGPQLDGSFTVQVVAVHPSFARHGLGFELLKQLMVASGSSVHWLLAADADTPARRLFARMGYRPLSQGPEAPNGEPGLVLVHG